MRNAYIKAVGAYAPERVIPNSFFNELLGEDVDTWLRENLTIRERRWTTDKEATSDLAINAGKLALERAGMNADELDLIIISTDTPEFISPSTASIVQHELQATNAGTFDVNTACAGFVTALDIGSKYIKADESINNVLVVGAYNMSKYLNMEDKKTVTLFADGAGAAILSATENLERGYVSSKLYTEGKYNSWMGIYAGGTRTPVTEEVLKNKDHLLKFVRKFPKELNPTIWTKMIKEVAAKSGWEISDIAHYFMTQININSIWETLDNLNVSRDKGHTIMDRYGYTGSACIPMALNDAYEKGKVKEGDKIIFIGSGGGLSFACASFVW
ncbi:MAG: ketoacyl-ACP synthase III [Ignavibacteria bacterium]|nr:MAG: ketoacyl-ACP synthase III [Ignavibacteria bacterium]